MTDPNYSVIVLVLDKSGSMASIRAKTISTVNEFIQTQKEVAGLADATVVLFNHRFSVPPLTKLADFPEFSNETYAPGGDTAMLAAVSGTIEEIGKRLQALPEERRPGQVIVAIMTDGQENPPQPKQVWDAVKAKVQHQTERYNWKFIFLGANIDAASVGEFIGVDVRNTSNFAATGRGMDIAMTAISHQVKAMRGGDEAYATAHYMAEAAKLVDEEEQVSGGQPLMRRPNANADGTGGN